MKFLKFSLLLLFAISIGIAGWIYYPQFTINKMKQESVVVDKKQNTSSLISYYQSLDKKEIYHYAIGDSVIRGFGVNEDENLVSQFSNQLSLLIEKNVQYTNAGMNGITSSELRGIVETGQLDEEIKKADIVTINVGGNDILRATQNLNYSKALQTFDELQSTFSENLLAISSRINELNPKATILFLELYNPLNANDQIYSLANQLLPNWNINIYEVASKTPGSIVVETTKVLNGKNDQYLSSDGIHPSSEGYNAISQQMVNQLKKVRISKEV